MKAIYFRQVGTENYGLCVPCSSSVVKLVLDWYGQFDSQSFFKMSLVIHLVDDREFCCFEILMFSDVFQERKHELLRLCDTINRVCKLH